MSVKISVFVVVLLLITIPFGVYLVFQTQIFRPKAQEQIIAAAPTPAPTPDNNTSYDMKVLVIKYFPLTPNQQNIDINVTGDVGEPYAVIKKRTDDVTNALKSSLEKASTYLGYRDTLAQPALRYSVIDTKEYTRAFPIQAGSTNKPDLNKVLSDHHICNYVDNQAVSEAWLWAYQGPGTPKLAISESQLIAGIRVNNQAYDSSNGIYYSAPRCQNTYRVYTFNYNSHTSTALESWGHQMENELNRVDYYGLFKNKFQGHGRCGSIHNPPNARSEYDRNNPIPQKSDCLDWNPDSLGQLTDISCSNWGCGESDPLSNNASLNYQIWNWQNLPGRNNNKYFRGNKLRNFWDIHGAFDQVMASSKSLYLSTNNATCGTLTAPSSVTAGQPFNVSLTMSNPAGFKTWTAGDNYRLGRWDSPPNNIWLLPEVNQDRVSLPSSQTHVNADSSVIFSFQVTAPTSIGTKTLDLRMVQDGVEWFGQTCSKTITVTSGSSLPKPNPPSFVSASSCTAGNLRLTWTGIGGTGVTYLVRGLKTDNANFVPSATWNVGHSLSTDIISNANNENGEAQCSGTSCSAAVAYPEDGKYKVWVAARTNLGTSNNAFAGGLVECSNIEIKPFIVLLSIQSPNSGEQNLDLRGEQSTTLALTNQSTKQTAQEITTQLSIRLSDGSVKYQTIKFIYKPTITPTPLPVTSLSFYDPDGKKISPPFKNGQKVVLSFIATDNSGSGVKVIHTDVRSGVSSETEAKNPLSQWEKGYQGFNNVTGKREATVPFYVEYLSEDKNGNLEETNKFTAVDNEKIIK